MNRRTALSTFLSGLAALIVPAAPPRRLTFTTSATLPSPNRVAVIAGADAKGNRISEEIEWHDDGREMISRQRYATWSLTLPGLCETSGTCSIGYEA
jgi:hypothetical protein